MFNISADTSNNLLSITLFDNNSIISTYVDSSTNQQTKNFFPILEDILARNNLSKNLISNLVVSVGPGSFTGIRVALAAVIGMKIASQINVFGISNFQALAFNVKQNSDFHNNITIAIKALRNQFYCQEFSKDLRSIGSAFLCDEAQIRKKDDGESFLHIIDNSVINSKVIAESFFYFQERNLLLPALPLYIREAITK